MFNGRFRLLAPSCCAVLMLLPQWVSGQALPTYPTSAGPAGTTVWTPDRYAPAQFNNGGSQQGRDNVLVLGVNEADGPGNRPPAQSSSFFDTQGRKLQRLSWGNLRYSFVGGVFVPATWTTSTGLLDSRRTDMWGVVTPTNVMSQSQAQYAIIGFTNEGVPDPTTIEAARNPLAPPDFRPQGGGTGRYQVWDPEAGGFQILPQPVQYDRWSDFCVTLTSTALEYRLGGALVYTDSTINVDLAGVPTPVTGFFEVIMQAKNFGERPTPPGGVAGVTYDTRWSALAAGPGSCDEVSILGGLAADLQISKSVAPSTVPVGGTTVFTLTVRNNGPAAATGTVVTDTLQAGLAYQSNTCGATFTAPTLTWNIGNLPNGQTATCSLTVQVTATGQFTNTAIVDADQTDPVVVNNSAQAAGGSSIVLQLPVGGWAGDVVLIALLGGVGLLAMRLRR